MAESQKLLNVLLIGKGAREHALAWKLKRSPLLGNLYLWPGNVAMQRLGKQLDVAPDLIVKATNAADFQPLVGAAKAAMVNLVIAGPEAPLAVGMADAFRQGGIPVFGPRANTARLESDKAFAKAIMVEAGIPTADFEVVADETACRAGAERRLHNFGGVVIKAAGLAAGKGVFVCQTQADIDAALTHLFHTEMHASATTVVLEDLLVGRECSYFCFLGTSKGQASFRLGFAVDYKRLSDQDAGPNTGGMGCYTPVPWLPADAAEKIENLVVAPLCRTLAKHGLEYDGCLYVGLMWANDGTPKVIEFNVRLGDPEAEVLVLADQQDWLARIADCLGMGLQVPMQNSNSDSDQARSVAAVAVVMAADTYPFGHGPGRFGVLPAAVFAGPTTSTAKSVVFGAGLTEGPAGFYQTGTGRVLVVAATGSTFAVARAAAYRQVDELKQHWPKAHCRSDIATAAVLEQGQGRP